MQLASVSIVSHKWPRFKINKLREKGILDRSEGGVQKHKIIMRVFPLPEEMGDRCQEASAGWLLWASSFTLLGLGLLICKMG